MFNFIKKYKILLAVELVCIIASVIMWIGASANGEEVVFSKEDLYITAENGGLQSNDIDLKAGVYQLRIVAEVPEGSSLYMHVQQKGNPYHSLLSNGETLYSGQSEIDFELYVSGNVEDVQVVGQCSGSGQIFIKTIELIRLNWGERILLTFVVLASILLNVIMYLRDAVRAEKLSTDRQVAFWILLSGVVIACFPYMTGYINLGDDTGFHLLRMEGLTDSILQGTRFPVKIQSSWLFDHGYAVSFFDGDLFLCLAVGLRLIGFSILTAFQFQVFAITLVTAYIAYWSFERMTGNKIAASMGAFFYVTAPYRLNMVYNMGALDDFSAMMFIPLIICGVYELYGKNVKNKNFLHAKYLLIVGLSGVLQSNLLFFKMTVIFLVIVILFLFKKSFKKEVAFEWIKIGVICLLINCHYWYPMFHMLGQENYLLHNVAMDTVQSGGASLAELLQVFVNEGRPYSRNFSLGIAVFGMIMLFAGNALVAKINKKSGAIANPYAKQIRISVLLMLMALLLSTKYFPWDLLGKFPGIKIFVSELKFPYRFLLPATAFAAVFVAYFVLWIKEEFTNKYGDMKMHSLVPRMMVTVFAIIMMASAVYQVNSYAFTFQPVWLYNVRNMGTQHVGKGEYLLEGTLAGDYYYHEPIATEGLEWSLYEKNGTTVQISLDNMTNAEAYLELPLIGYKGYAIEMVEGAIQEKPYITEERGAHGDLRIAVPEDFVGTIEVSYKGHWSYRVAEVISLITLIVLCGYGIGKRRKQWTAKS